MPLFEAFSISIKVCWSTGSIASTFFSYFFETNECKWGCTAFFYGTDNSHAALYTRAHTPNHDELSVAKLINALNKKKRETPTQTDEHCKEKKLFWTGILIKDMRAPKNTQNILDYMKWEWEREQRVWESDRHFWFSLIYILYYVLINIHRFMILRWIYITAFDCFAIVDGIRFGGFLSVGCSHYECRLLELRAQTHCAVSVEHKRISNAIRPVIKIATHSNEYECKRFV